MRFNKIPKEVWLTMSPEEREYQTLKFNASIESRKRKTIIITRGLALACILIMIFIGVAQFKAVENYNKIIDKYGSNGYCYLCGEYTLKKCDCQYFTNEFVSQNKVLFDNYSMKTAEYNSKYCTTNKLSGEGIQFNQFITEDIKN
jgi:hypothetical protein